MSGPDEYYATEYQRRNMQVARVCGANASVDLTLKRALANKSTPNWIIAYLESAVSRLPGLQHDLAAWRDLAPDAPDVVKQKARSVLAALPEVQDIVRQAVEAERGRIISALRCEADVIPCSEDAMVTEGCADLIEANFCYDEAERIAAIRKRGEG